MDEILASIRRIIADEDGAGELPAAADAPAVPQAAPRPAEAPPPPHAPAQPQRWQERAGVSLRPVAPASEARPAAIPAEPVRAPEPAAARSASPAPGDPVRPKPLLAPETDSAVASAFDSLGALLVPAQQRSVEDLMKEMLRPMLKTWLDENLPRLVEGLVRQEIERITRRGR